MDNKKAIEALKPIKSTGGWDFMCGECPTCDESCELFQALGLAIKALENSSWIPVSERLPEINVDVIVTDIETTGTYSAYYLGDGFWECDNGTHKNRIVAWMPLPEPYTKEDSDT